MAIDDDIESYLDPVSLNRAVRGGDKLQGVQPELLSHWNNLQGEFSKAGLTPEIKSGFRTAEQQNALFRNPATSAKTKGNDGYVNISPHQRGDALDIVFPSAQRATGRKIIANYAQRNGLHVPSDEPWHIAIPRQSKASVESYLDPQQPAQSTSSKPAPSIESYLDPQEPAVAGRGAAMARAQGSRQPVTRGAQQGWGGGGTIGEGITTPLPATAARSVMNRQPVQASAAGRSAFALTPEEQMRITPPGTITPTTNRLVADVINQKEQADTASKGLSNIAAMGGVPTSLLPKDAEDWINSAVAQGGAGLLTTAAGLVRHGIPALEVAKMFGAPDVLQKPVADRLQASSDELSGASQAIDRNANRGVLSQGIKDVIGGGIATTPAMILMSMGVPAPVAFGMQSSAEAQGRDADLADVVKETTKGAAIGALFELPLPSRIAMANQLGQRLAKAGIVGVGTKAVDLVSGTDPKNLSSPIVNALFAASGAPKSEGMPEVAPREASISPVIADARVERIQTNLQGSQPAEVSQTAPQGTAEAVKLAGAQGRLKTLPQPNNTNTIVPGTAPAEPLRVERSDAEGAKLNRWQHRDFGAVTESANQSSVGKGRVRVLAEDGTEHVIQRPTGTGAGNQIAVPLRAKPVDNQTADAQAEAERTAPFRVIDKRGQPSETELSTQQAEARRQQVASNVTPQPDLSTQAQPAIPDTTTDEGLKFAPKQLTSGEPQTAQPAPPIPEGKPSEPIKEPLTTSARKAQMSEDRATLDLPELPPAERKSWQTSLSNAKPERASLLADEVLTKPRALNDEETASLVVRAQQIKNEHAQVMKELGGAKGAETIATKRAQSEALEREFDRITRATKASGTEKGRTLAAQKLTINQDYDLVSVLQRMKAAKGRELTVDERTKYTDMVKERDQALADRDAALERAHTAELQKQINKSVRQRKRSETKESLDAEAATIKTNIAAEFARLRSAQSSVHSAFGLGSLDPEGVITKELLKYARNRVKANVGLKAEALIDEVHDLVKDFASRRQVAEVLSGYMKPRDAREADAATKQLADIRKEIAEGLAKEDVAAGTRTETSQGPSKRFVSRNVTRLKQLQAKEADLTARMAAGDYSARPRTQPLPYNREVTAAQERVGRIEQQFNDEAAKREPKTPLDYIVKWKRFAVLSRPSTLLKLGSAAVGRMGVTPLEEAIGGAVSKVLPGLAERAPREGRFNFRAEAKAISQMWQGDTFRDAVKQITTGKDSLDILYGDKRGDTEMLNFPGRVHGAIKELPKRAEFFRSFEKRLESASRQGRDVSDPDVQMGIAMEAYSDARRAIFQQPNPISDVFTSAVKSLERGGRGSKVLGKALQFAFPVTRVPVNVVGETLNYALGAPRAVAQTVYLKLFKDGFQSLSPEQADSLMRAYKKGGVGLGVMALAYLNPQMFGGYYQRGEKRDPKEAQPGEMVVDGQRVPKLLIHTPFFEAMQVGATVRRVSDAMKAKEKGGLTEGAEAAGLGLAHEVPFYETPRRYFEGVEGGGQALRKVAYGEAKSMIPGVVQEVAEQTDRQNGQIVKRSSRTLSETLKSGIPGLRQTVPEKNSSGKLLNSRNGNDPLAKELVRIDHQVNGVSKAPDELQSDFEKRRAAVNPQIEADLKDLVDSREYKALSDADKKEQITMHLRSVTKTANENYYLQNGGEKVKTPRQLYIAPQRAVAP